jgi:hypothetical protein
MKKLLILLMITTGAINFLSAQNNTFPTTGNAGAKTTTPISELQVAGTLSIGVGASATTKGVLQVVPGISTNTYNHRLLIATDATGGAKYNIAKNITGTITDLFTVQDNGNVGVGIATPAFKLDVAGAINATGPFTSAGLITGSTLKLTGLSGAAKPIGVDATGNIVGLTAGTYGNGLTLTGTLAELGGTLTKATTINQSTFNLGFTGTGNVGIGTATPTTKLDVAGAINTNSTINATGAITGGSTIAATGAIKGGTVTSTNLLTAGSLKLPATLPTITGTAIGVDVTGLVGKIAVAGAGTSSNGLTTTTGNTVLGGTLTQATTIAAGTNNLLVTGTSGVNSLTVLGTGNVGIGTATPTTKLEVAGAINTNSTINATGAITGGSTIAATGAITGGTVTSTNLLTAGSLKLPATLPTITGTAIGVDATGLVGKIAVAGAGTSSNGLTTATGNTVLGGTLTQATTIAAGTNNLLVTGNAGVNSLTVLGTGNVGIGTATPTTKLDVAGAINSNSTINATGAITGGTVTSTNLLTAGSLKLPAALPTITGTSIGIDATGLVGKVTVSGAGTSSNGLTTTTGNTVLGGTLTQATTIAAGTNNLLVTGSSGVNSLTVLGTGNVGIGTASPTTKLDVAGAINTNSTINATGAITGGNLVSSGSITSGSTINATGAITGGTVTSTSLATVGNLKIAGLTGPAVVNATNGKALTVNATGDVVLVDDKSGTAGITTGPFIKKTSTTDTNVLPTDDAFRTGAINIGADETALPFNTQYKLQTQGNERVKGTNYSNYAFVDKAKQDKVTITTIYVDPVGGVDGLEPHQYFDATLTTGNRFKTLEAATDWVNQAQFNQILIRVINTSLANKLIVTSACKFMAKANITITGDATNGVQQYLTVSSTISTENSDLSISNFIIDINKNIGFYPSANGSISFYKTTFNLAPGFTQFMGAAFGELVFVGANIFNFSANNQVLFHPSGNYGCKITFTYDVTGTSFITNGFTGLRWSTDSGYHTDTWLRGDGLLVIPPSINTSSTYFHYGSSLGLKNTFYDPTSINYPLNIGTTTPIRTMNMNAKTPDFTGLTKQVVVDSNGVFGVKSVVVGAGNFIKKGTTTDTNVLPTDDAFRTGAINIGSDTLKFNSNYKVQVQGNQKIVNTTAADGSLNVQNLFVRSNAVRLSKTIFVDPVNGNDNLDESQYIVADSTGNRFKSLDAALDWANKNYDSELFIKIMNSKTVKSELTNLKYVKGKSVRIVANTPGQKIKLNNQIWVTDNGMLALNGLDIESNANHAIFASSSANKVDIFGCIFTLAPTKVGFIYQDSNNPIMISGATFNFTANNQSIFSLGGNWGGMITLSTNSSINFNIGAFTGCKFINAKDALGRTQNCVLQVGENFTFPTNLSLDGIQVQYGKNITLGQTIYDPNNVSGNLQKHMVVAYSPTPIRTPEMNSASIDLTGVTKQVVVDANGVFGVKSTTILADTSWKASGINTIFTRSGNVGIGTLSPTSKFQVGGNVQFDGLKTINLIRTAAVTIGSYVDLGTFNKTNGAHTMQIMINSSNPSYSVAKIYNLATQYNQTTGIWKALWPNNDTGVYTDDFELLVNVLNNETSLRIRKSLNGTMGGTYSVTILYTGYTDAIWTESNLSGTDLVNYGLFEGNILAQVKGRVGIKTTVTPYEQFEIGGDGRMFIGDGLGNKRKGLLIDAVEDGTYVRLHPYDYATPSKSMNLSISPFGGGNVGIGNNNPTAKLHVTNGDNSYGSILATANETSFNLYSKTLTTATNAETFRFGLKYGTDENNGFISFYRGTGSSGGTLGFATNGTEKMKIDINGGIGIGLGSTTIPGTHKLAVGGSIIAEEVLIKLKTAWPDYVFAKNYKLKPLEEVEQFIKSNNHLPNVPSAAEVKDNGVALGENAAKLLEKIEELTLYMIELKKENDNMKKRLTNLEGLKRD